jgi:hypothetical protein
VGTAQYQLRKQTADSAHYADVTVSAETADHFSIEISPQAFAWLKDVYGSDAWEWAQCDEFRAAAKRGAEFAIANIGTEKGTFYFITKSRMPLFNPRRKHSLAGRRKRAVATFN